MEVKGWKYFICDILEKAFEIFILKKSMDRDKCLVNDNLYTTYICSNFKTCLFKIVSHFSNVIEDY